MIVTNHEGRKWWGFLPRGGIHVVGHLKDVTIFTVCFQTYKNDERKYFEYGQLQVSCGVHAVDFYPFFNISSIDKILLWKKTNSCCPIISVFFWRNFLDRAFFPHQTLIIHIYIYRKPHQAPLDVTTLEVVKLTELLMLLIENENSSREKTPIVHQIHPMKIPLIIRDPPQHHHQIFWLQPKPLGV